MGLFFTIVHARPGRQPGPRTLYKGLVNAGGRPRPQAHLVANEPADRQPVLRVPRLQPDQRNCSARNRGPLQHLGPSQQAYVNRTHVLPQADRAAVRQRPATWAFTFAAIRDGRGHHPRRPWRGKRYLHATRADRGDELADGAPLRSGGITGLRRAARPSLRLPDNPGQWRQRQRHQQTAMGTGRLGHGRAVGGLRRPTGDPTPPPESGLTGTWAVTAHRGAAANRSRRRARWRRVSPLLGIGARGRAGPGCPRRGPALLPAAGPARSRLGTPGGLRRYSEEDPGPGGPAFREPAKTLLGPENLDEIAVVAAQTRTGSRRSGLSYQDERDQRRGTLAADPASCLSLQEGPAGHPSEAKDGSPSTASLADLDAPPSSGARDPAGQPSRDRRPARQDDEEAPPHPAAIA